MDLDLVEYRIKMVFIVLVVSTTDCGSVGLGSNPNNHPTKKSTSNKKTVIVH